MSSSTAAVSRRIRAEGSYGFLLGTKIHLSTAPASVQLMQVDGFEPGGRPPLQWLTCG